MPTTAKSDALVLGLDLGTTNIKALATTLDGREVAFGSAAVKLHRLPGGGVEQDIAQIRQATLAALSQAAQGCDASRIAAMGVSAQGGALQVVDGQGHPLGRVISWLDSRGAPYDRKVIEELGRPWLARHIGYGASGIAVGQVLRLRDESPGLLDKPHRLLAVGDLVVQSLCGRGAHDATSLGLFLLYNPWQRQADPDILARLGLAEDQLPQMLGPRESAGPLNRETAEATGLPEGIPVSPAVHDQYCAALGCAAVRPGDMMLGTGTAWVLLATTDHLTPGAVNEAFVCTHVVDGLYGQMLSMVNGGSSLDWAMSVLKLDAGQNPDAILQSVPAGATGLRFWPLLAEAGGARLAPGTAGRLDGLRLAHTPAHILRAVVEGLALELERYRRLLAQGGLETRRIILGGGAASSLVTPQILADVTGLELACLTQSAMSAQGAAALARGLIEPDQSLARIAQEMSPSCREIASGPDHESYRSMVEHYIESLPVKTHD